MSQRKYKRTKKLIKPRFQLKVAGACLGIAVMAVITLMILMNDVILDFADKGWVDSAAVQDKWAGVLLTKLGIALMILAPMTLALGVILMHRIAGPLYRFEQFIQGVVRGEQTDICRIRQGDELQDLCDLLNEFTAPLRDGTVDLAPFQASLRGRAPNELAAEPLEVEADAEAA
ncbi:MAG: hypothetical protein O2894_07160 [Planctomycetota bacterium]|nr:hypothetical protein [Planctomycetota bacterium]